MALMLGKRLLAAVLIILSLTAILFGLQHASHTDPVHAFLGPGASAQTVAATRARLGLDDPLPTQYVRYVKGLTHGDFGVSYRTRHPVSDDLSTFFPASLELMVAALLLALVLAVVLAVATTLQWPGAAVFRLLLIAGSAAPAFLLALGGIIIFYKQLGWLPATGRTSLLDAPTGPTGLLTIDGVLAGRPEVVSDALKHLLLPSVALAAGPAVAIGRVLRSSLVATMRQDYTRTARAKGLPEIAVLRRHVLRNSIGPALSMTGLQVGLMFAGVLVIEQIFAWPGLGQYTAQSVPISDFPAIAGVTLALGVAYVAINTVVDVLQATADPRIDV